MSKSRIVLNREGVRALLRSPEMLAIVERHAQAIQQRCGAGYERDSYSGKNRVNAMVWPSDEKAEKENLKSNTLLKAIK